MAVLDIQRRGQQIGRIRIGQQIAVIKDGKDTGKTRPDKLDTFRFTTGSQVHAESIAALYGGEVRHWRGEFEVITGKNAIGITVPPRDEVVSQWYEMWNKGGCLRRCDSQTEQISGKPCLCPHAEDPGSADECEAAAKERSRLASQVPPQACKLVTRINVMIPDLPGLGVFRLDTGSYYAAVEIGDSAHLMQVARDRGVFLPAVLRIEQRQRVAGGRTKIYPVPVLEVLATFRDLATGAIEQRGIAAQLPPEPGVERLAIAAPRPALPAFTAEVVPEGDGQGAGQPRVTAQEIADLAATTVTKAGIKELMRRAAVHRCEHDEVAVDGQFEELGAHLNGLLRVLVASEEES